MSLSLGPFITCFLCTNILCIILHYLIYKKKIVFDKSLRFIFWIIGIILLRMVLPFNFPFTYTSYSDNILPKIVDFIYYKLQHGKIMILDIGLIIWGIGSIFQIIIMIRSNIRLRRYVKNHVISMENPIAEEIIDIVQNELLFEKIEVAVLPEFVSPAIIGIKQPILIISEKYCFSRQELKLVCEHEINHYIKGDLILMAIINIVSCIQWWNPVIHFFKEELILALELSNDFQIIENQSDAEKIEYAELILKIAKEKEYFKTIDRSFVTCFVGKNKTNLKTRIDYILKKNKKKKSVVYIINILMISVMLLSVFWVPEATHPIDPDNQENSIEMSPKNTYFLKKREGYQIFVNNKLWGEVKEIPDGLENIPIRKSVRH